MLNELRNLIRALINESDSRPTSGPGIVLTRYGGLSPVPTTGGPERRGLYAFIHGKIEPFLAGSTDSEGITDHERPSRSTLAAASRRPAGDRDPSLGLRYFRYDGPIYTHFNIHDEPDDEDRSSGAVGHWYRTTARELREYVFGKKYVDDFKSAAESFNDDIKQRGLPRKRFLPANWKTKFSKDDFEVFIPARGGKFLPYEKDPRMNVDPGEELPDRRARLPMSAKIARGEEISNREAERKYANYFSKTLEPEDAEPKYAKAARQEQEEFKALWDRGRARGRYKNFDSFEEFAAWMHEKKYDAKFRADAYQADILNKKEQLKPKK